MNYPNMLSEVIEAVHLMYEDTPDVEADCYLYLENLGVNDVKVLKIAANQKLSDIGRCTECGTMLQTQTYKEYHSEVDSYETLHEIYCPKCDRGIE